MTSSEFAKRVLRLDRKGIEKEGSYVIILDDSDDYSQIYSMLDSNEDIDLDPEEMSMSEHSSVMTYMADEFDIILEANFDDDSYTLTIKEVE